MLVNYRHIIVQVLLILLIWCLIYLLRRFTRGRQIRRFSRYIWTVVLWVLSLANLGMYWIAYPIALWMILALALIFIQLVHNHEFIYRRYWPVFWQLSAGYAGLVFIVSLFSGNLPLI